MEDVKVCLVCVVALFLWKSEKISLLVPQNICIEKVS
jgi:hypothetical protein